MTVLHWLARGTGRRISVVMALLLGLLVPGGMAYFRRSRSVPPVIVVCCVDERCSRDLPAGYCWRWPGCAKGLVEDADRRELFFKDVHYLRREGLRFEKIILVDHHDCRGYGKDDSPENHCDCLRRAKQLIQEDVRVADLPVELYLFDPEARTFEVIES